jgi:hypothetical protein
MHQTIHGRLVRFRVVHTIIKLLSVAWNAKLRRLPPTPRFTVAATIPRRPHLSLRRFHSGQHGAAGKPMAAPSDGKLQPTAVSVRCSFIHSASSGIHCVSRSAVQKCRVPLLDEILAREGEESHAQRNRDAYPGDWFQHPSERLALEGSAEGAATKWRKRPVGWPEAANELPVSHVHGVISKLTLAAVRLSRSGTRSKRS